MGVGFDDRRVIGAPDGPLRGQLLAHDLRQFLGKTVRRGRRLRGIRNKETKLTLPGNLHRVKLPPSTTACESLHGLTEFVVTRHQ